VSSLVDLPLKLSDRTGRDDILRGFFVPCLQASVLYRRTAGYFTSAGLNLAARGVASLAHRHGRMRLVVSPYLEPVDIEPLERAKDDPAAVLRTIAARSLADIEDALVLDRLSDEQHGLRARHFTSRKTQKERDAILLNQLSGFRDAALPRNPTPNRRKLVPRFDGCRRQTIK
jgi:hypothetical protein